MGRARPEAGENKGCMGVKACGPDPTHVEGATCPCGLAGFYIGWSPFQTGNRHGRGACNSVFCRHKAEEPLLQKRDTS